jgi:hypothetical protein
MVVVAASAHGATFFVNAGTGDDSNPGTSAAKPLLTIQTAIDAAALRPGPDMIQIAKGEYQENLAISDADGLTLSGGNGVLIVAANASKDVIKISWGDVSLSEVTITGGNKGIAPTGSAGKPVSLSLQDVVVMDNSGDGVKPANVVDVRASQCMFLGNGGTGLKVQTADSVTVSHCTFEGNTGRGLRSEDVKSTTVSHCQFLDNNDDGIKVVTAALNRTKASLSISDTTISGSADDGIDLEAIGDVRVTNVTVRNTVGDDGMSIDDTVSVVVIDSMFTNSNADGLDMDDTESIRLVNVTSTGNNNSGFQITAEEHYNIESVNIVGSEFSDNGLDGIWIAEEGSVVERVSLTSVTANDNGESGWDISVTGPVKLSATTSQGNGQPNVP